MEDKKLKKFTTLGKRASNMIKDKIEDIKYLILDVILKCLMKVFKMKEDELREAFIKSWRIEYDTTRENKTES